MESWIEGIHHVTGAAVDPQVDHDFYTKVLGLRLVKRTVNHENPVMWHFFYGDYAVHAGTVMTNFLFKGLRVPDYVFKALRSAAEAAADLKGDRRSATERGEP